MQITKRVIHLAKERALCGFSVLAQNMLSSADDNLIRSTAIVRLPSDQKALTAARVFLRHDGKLFLQRLEMFFGDYLERAMQTMYTDLRMGLNNISADRLSLLDDETVTRQIEVDRLVLRMRDVDPENLGRLNMMIAQLHGDHDVRERENPFRPYLLARSLYEVVREMAKEEALAKVLFDYCSNAMAHQLPGYYAAIREVFETSGVRTRFLARPSAMTRGQRERMARKQTGHQAGFGITLSGMHPDLSDSSIAPDMLPQNVNARILSGLQRILALQQSAPPGLQKNESLPVLAQKNQSVEFQDFVWQIFNQPKPAGLPRSMDRGAQAPRSPAAEAQERNAAAKAPSPLVSQLKQYQQAAARGQAVNEEISPDQNQIFALREKIDIEKASDLDRVTLDVVALLFEFILQDDQIPADLRAQIGRLQLPFLRAAMLAPDLLHEASHPARQLLNRMGAVSVGLVSGTAFDQAIESEIHRIVSKILENFDDDMAIFTNCLENLDAVLHEQLGKNDADASLLVEAVEEAEKASAVLANTANALQGLLAPLSVDQRVFDFIMQTWVRVLVHPFSGKAPPHAQAMHAQLKPHEVLPELVWSAQEKQTPQERGALMKLLPGLVKRLKKGLEMIALPEQESKRAMDPLVTVHTQVLRASQASTEQTPRNLDDLHRHFSTLTIDDGSAFWMEDEPVKVHAADVAAALAKRGVSAMVKMEHDVIPALASDAEWLSQMQLGMSVELWSDDNAELARITWISTHRSLYVFTPYDNSKPVIYSSVSLLKALRDGLVRPVEYAPLFERAVESLMVGAETL